ncbi:dnaJ homolog subfamily C member 24-like [Diadema setosum]|uniref:dnaJ homolog subfamily C member 24-like n=1 Tax=Diadema setosum TaxID=31175 RepID=UPI003B3BA44F
MTGDRKAAFSDTQDVLRDEAPCGDLYAVLGAEPSASDVELKALYRKHVLQCHPDKVLGDNQKQHQAMLEFQSVHRAWETLGDPGKRSLYDKQLRADQLKGPMVNDEILLDDMSWDEDEGGYHYECRCGGEYTVSLDDASEAEEAQENRLVNCSNCSLCILVCIVPSSEDADSGSKPGPNR